MKEPKLKRVHGKFKPQLPNIANIRNLLKCVTMHKIDFFIRSPKRNKVSVVLIMYLKSNM